MKRSGLMIAVLGIFLAAQAAQAQWTPAKRLTWTSGASYYPAVAVDSSGNVYVVWQDDTLGNFEIYHKNSTDGGTTWTQSKRLSTTSGGSAYPTIAVDASGDLHAFWHDDTPGNSEIYYRKSSDGGATWSTSKRLTWTPGGSFGPVTVFDSQGNFHMVWYDETPANHEIYYTKSTDGGITWSTSKRLTWTSGGSYLPVIAVDSSDNLHVVWYDDTPGNSEIYYKKSSNGGATWTPSQRLTWTSGYSSCPVIAVDASGNLHVVWSDETPGNAEIYYVNSPDGGTTWATSKRLTWNAGASVYPAIAVDSLGNPHVVWHDNTSGDSEVYYKSSPDGGASWTTSKRLTMTSGGSYVPAIAVDSSDNLHLVWMDTAPGNLEIYYMKGK